MEKKKLFCLPYAGGSAMIYNKWAKKLDKSIELRPLELKGRGRRFNETFYRSFDEAVEDLYGIIKNEIDNCTYYFFGHSMGTMLIYELINRIRQERKNEPVHIFFSGRYPPHINRNKQLYRLPDDEFKMEIYKYGGMPKEFLENKELMDIFIPILRADYKMLETHQYEKLTNKYSFDITVLGGKEDDEVKSCDLLEWADYTSRGFSVYEFDGGHFFINDRMEEITDIINEKLRGSNTDSMEKINEVLFG